MTVYYSPEQVAEKLGVGAETIRRWVRQGTINAVKVNRLVRIPETEVARAFGTDPDMLVLGNRIEHELALHRPFGGICATCGQDWPCDPVVEAAEALDVDWRA